MSRISFVCFTSCTRTICAPFSALSLYLTPPRLAHKVTAAVPITRSAAFFTPVTSPMKRLREAAIYSSTLNP